MTEFQEGLLTGLLAGGAAAGFIVYRACSEAIKQAHNRAIEGMIAGMKERHPSVVKSVLERMRSEAP